MLTLSDCSIAAESVTEGHPDKIADQISDTILDLFIMQDPNARVACETLISDGLVVIAGEIRSKATVDFTSIVRQTLIEIGYTKAEFGIDPAKCRVIVAINEQSLDCSRSIDLGLAGDQAVVVGYATNETDAFMPMPIYLAHRLSYQLATIRKEGILDYLLPDGKTQVIVEYLRGKINEISSIIVSPQHMQHIDLKALEQDIYEFVIKPVIPTDLLTANTRVFVNRDGRFVVGGPAGDTGLTGRKVISDTYGGGIPHGGGAFSGKDPTKIDRTASYMARYIAKNIVAAHLADKCKLELIYAKGEYVPVSISIESFGTNAIPESSIRKLITDSLDLSLPAMIERLNLRRPIYRQTSVYGHFGRNNSHFTWEKTDLAAPWEKEIGINRVNQ